jgi:hypothetical protein
MLASPMFYEVKLSPPERELVASLVGKPLDRVTTDRWAVELRSGASAIRVVPEEAATPDAEHPQGDVDRPSLQAISDLSSAKDDILVAEGLGIVRAANVISTLITFSPVVDCTGEEIAPGVRMPDSTGYGYVYHHPDQRKDAESAVGGGAVVDLDIAVELITDNRPSVVIYTRLFWVLSSLDGLPTDEDWVAVEAYKRRSVG